MAWFVCVIRFSLQESVGRFAGLICPASDKESFLDVLRGRVSVPVGWLDPSHSRVAGLSGKGPPSGERFSASARPCDGKPVQVLRLFWRCRLPALAGNMAEPVMPPAPAPMPAPPPRELRL